MKKPLVSAVSALTLAMAVAANAEQKAETESDSSTTPISAAKIEALEKRIEELEADLEQKLGILADAVEAKSDSRSKVKFGGYGEMHYLALDNGEEETRELDFHRFVLFTGYEFNDRARLVSELEVEHSIASAGNRGAVELEQAYIELDLKERMQLQSGIMLVPIGIINETHEPPTFYGVERPVVETTIIPTTWYVGGLQFKHSFTNGWSYNLMVSEGFKTGDPNADVEAEPFNLKGGKQKASFANAYDWAVTARATYRGVPGLELAAYTQYQPDLDQSARTSYADSAIFAGGHVIYRWNKFETRALYGRWQFAGDEAKDAGKDL